MRIVLSMKIVLSQVYQISYLVTDHISEAANVYSLNYTCSGMKEDREYNCTEYHLK